MNPFLSLAGAGMIFTGVFAVMFWKKRTGAGWRYFGLGALMWVAAMIPKVVMDLTVTPILSAEVFRYGVLAYLVVMGIYVGLRTGFFESGLSYIAALKKLREVGWREAVAFGLGFGSIEAILLGCQNLVSILALYFLPSAFESLPQALQKSLSLPTIVVFAPIAERAFAILLHLFASLMLIYAASRAKSIYFVASILFRALADGLVSTIHHFFNLTTVQEIYLAETPFLIIAIISLYGIRWIRGRYQAGAADIVSPKLG